MSLIGRFMGLCPYDYLIISERATGLMPLAESVALDSSTFHCNESAALVHRLAAVQWQKPSQAVLDCLNRCAALTRVIAEGSRIRREVRG